MRSFFNKAASISAGVCAGTSALGVAAYAAGTVGELTCKFIDAQNTLPYFELATFIGVATHLATIPGLIWWDVRRLS